MSRKNAGYIVKTKTGKMGRTYHSKGLINGKIPVYLEKSKDEHQVTAILCRPETLEQIGFID